MAQERVQRRLAAILAADVVGYSRLMAADEPGTLAALKILRQELMEPCIAERGGRIVKLMGDGALVEFASALDAVECAVAIQRGMEQRNADLPESRHVILRIGINLGDVIIDGQDIYGDGVNVAARLESLAEPGGICLSDMAHSAVQGKLDIVFEDRGEHELKNIARPLRLWSWAAYSGSVDSSAHGARVTLSDKPSIAVLPFDNMSRDPDQDFFADGIVDELITELSRFSDLFVIARNSTFAYKGRAVKVQNVGRELGVAHVLEGGVRKAGSRVRITVQLIDAANGNHIWAERYDREYADIFDLQDEITQAIVGVLPGRVELAAAAKLKRKRLGDMAAYDYLLAGRIHHDRGTQADNIEALRLLDKAIELEPDYAAAWAWRACTLGQALDFDYLGDPENVFRQAVESVEKAMQLDDNDVNCHRLLCEVNMDQNRLDLAQKHHERAFMLNPNDVRIVAQRGELLTWVGRPEEGAEWVKKAMRLDPFAMHKRAHLLGRALYATRRYAEALDAFKEIPTPRYTHLADMAACHAQLEETAAAEARAAELLRLKPSFSTRAYVARLHYVKPEHRAHHSEGLYKAGLPD